MHAMNYMVYGCNVNYFVYSYAAVHTQARSQGGLVGSEEPPLQIKGPLF